ncbi:Rtr1/RPAP2 family, putative [Leishmania lindenbergi]|uniref:Rtr1/RPAP2 family n=1 Tax=Leishmania lindenbergi TaxID=651832 RepID=A0AAW3AHH7_9TRYP
MSLQATESAVKYRSGTSGGAWEVIIDKAVSFVTEYLASTTREFDPAAPLSQHMLRLIDRGSLRDILVERNYNELCGCFGCGNKPRGILAAGSGALSFEWHSALSSSVSSAESDDGVIHEEADGPSHGAHRRGQGGAANDAAAAAQSTEDQPDADPEEIVYEEDLYTVESFRLAQRQRAILNRMQRKKVMREQRAMRAATMSDGAAAAAAAVGPAPVGPGGTALAASRVLRNGLLGASFPQRFCSPECEEAYESTVMPRVSPYFAYDYPSVVGAITSLFPNLRVAVLQQLAGAETSAAGLVKPILETQQQEDGGVPTEASASGSTLKAVQVGAVYESTELNRGNPSKRMARVVHRARSADGAAKMDNASSAPLLREVLEQMHVLQHVWNNEVAPRLCGTHLPRVVDAAATMPPPTSAVAAAGHFGYAQVLTLLPPRPVLRNSLLVFDFIMNTSCAQTRRLFYAHYACHRPALQRCLSAAASPRAPTAGSLFHSVSSDIISELEKRHIKALAVAGVTDGSVGDMAFGTEDEGLRVDPVLQQQRRELLVSHLFSEDVTATLSHLLLVDYAVLSNMAWSGVWFSSMPLRLPGKQQNSSCSLLYSLQFPFAIPAVLLQAVESTPEVLGLAMVFLVAAGCCSADVWCGCMREEVAFDEVAGAIGLTRDDIAAAVRSLMLGEGV